MVACAFVRVAARYVAGLACVGSLAGCAVPYVSLREGPREYVATDYEDVFRKWTRTERLVALSELDNFLTVTATFESYDFKWAYVLRYVQDYRLTIEQRKRLLDSALAETREQHAFYVALYGGDRRFNDLSKPDSAFIVRLIDEQGNETAPTEIAPIKRPGVLERTYFPYTTPFRRVFRIRFPHARADGKPTIAPDARWFGLRFAGAQGNAELSWAIEPPAGPPTPSR